MVSPTASRMCRSNAGLGATEVSSKRCALLQAGRGDQNKDTEKSEPTLPPLSGLLKTQKHIGNMNKSGFGAIPRACASFLKPLKPTGFMNVFDTAARQLVNPCC